MQRREQRAFGKRRLALTLVAIVAAMLGTSPLAAGQSGVGAAAIPDPGRFQNMASGRCLDASNGGAGRDVIQWACHYGANQYWNVVPLDGGFIGMVNRASYQCLEGLGAQQGWDAVQSDCSWGDSQHWYPYQLSANEWALINKVSWKCLDAADWGNGVNVYTYDCHYGRNQRWHRMDR